MLKSTYSINFSRLAFLIIAILGGIAIAASTKGTSYPIPIWVSTLVAVCLSMSIIYLEHLSRQFTLRGFSTATFGLMIGILCAWLLNKLPLEEFLDAITDSPAQSSTLLLIYRSITYLTLSFLGIVISLRSGQEDFAFIIPYIRFRQSNVSEQQLLLDPSVLIDGRLMPLLESRALEGRLVIPRYALEELKKCSQSGISSQKERGERALSLLQDLQEHSIYRITLLDNDEGTADEPLDDRLAHTARIHNAKLITTNDSLTKMARLEDISVLNINDVAASFQPMTNVGDQIQLTITRPGKEEHQGVGYLSDGSMIVVNHGAQFMGKIKTVVVTSKLQSSSGLMIFAELKPSHD